MGLIKAAVGAVGSTLHDQWKEAIRCEDLGNDILMKKVTTPNGVISNGSTIIVGPGQCAVVYDNGRIVDASAEEGLFTFEDSGTPSFFAGQFGAVFKEMWQRFTYNGATAKQQAVFYFNIKEILDNKFGTSTPVMFRDWTRIIPNEMTGTSNPLPVNMRCHGTYTFRLVDPATFMSNIAGTADVYKVSELEGQMHSEIISVFQSVLNLLGTEEYRINYLDLPSKADLIKELMAKKDFDGTIKNRGIKIETFNIESVSLDDASASRVEQYDNNSNSRMQQGRVLDVMETAGKNGGYMGIGMMNMTSGGMGSAVMNNAFNPQPAAPVQQNVTSGVNCPNCGAVATGKFCGECGTKIEVNGPKHCTNCGKELGANAKFCGECGTKVE